MTGLAIDIASSTTAPPHSSRLGSTRASASRSHSAQLDCGSQPAKWTRARAPGHRCRRCRARAASASSRPRSLPSPRIQRRIGALGAGPREGMQQQIDRLPVDQPAHVGEGGHRRRRPLGRSAAAPARGSGRRRSRPARRPRRRAPRAAPRGCAGWRRAGSRRGASRASAGSARSRSPGRRRTGSARRCRDGAGTPADSPCRRSSARSAPARPGRAASTARAARPASAGGPR